ncbi:MAG: hypothetical protein NC102_10565 [Clostridium sp.]|nr:hypothetical protein [Clostridium sp.]
MGKKLLLLFAVFLTMVRMNAQSSLVATLSHEGQITTFNGSNAFVEAVGAAVDGDIITLSEGQFNKLNINKSITVRGAGMMPGENPSILAGEFAINAPNITFEGILVNATNAVNVYGGHVVFNKCCMEDLTLAKEGCSVQLINTIITEQLHVNGEAEAINSVIGQLYLANYESKFNGTNCIIGNPKREYSSNLYDARASNFNNCIFYQVNNIGSTNFSQDQILNNCFFIGDNKTPFYVLTMSSTNNKVFPADTPVFKEGTTAYELLDELQATWLGDDGTQAGIHGGQMPFDPTPSNPQITKFNVASKTTVDGKLAIDIEVKVQ